MNRGCARPWCGGCGHFVDDPDELERSLVGLTILSSARGDSRGDQGLCELHQLFLDSVMSCPGFIARPRTARPDGGGGANVSAGAMP